MRTLCFGVLFLAFLAGMASAQDVSYCHTEIKASAYDDFNWFMSQMGGKILFKTKPGFLRKSSRVIVKASKETVDRVVSRYGGAEFSHLELPLIYRSTIKRELGGLVPRMKQTFLANVGTPEEMLELLDKLHTSWLYLKQNFEEKYNKHIVVHGPYENPDQFLQDPEFKLKLNTTNATILAIGTNRLRIGGFEVFAGSQTE